MSALRPQAALVLLLALATTAIAAAQAPPQPDQDADGVSAPADCNDLDPAVRPGRPEIPENGLDDDCAGGDARLPHTKAMPRLLLQPQPDRSFLVRRAIVRHVSSGSTVVARCRGYGCRVPAVRRYVRSYTRVLTIPGFRGMRARPGTRISLLVSHPRQIGIVTAYQFLRRGGARARECEVAPGSLMQDC